MTVTVSLFCDACGFALPAQATCCPACGHCFSVSSSPRSAQAAPPAFAPPAPVGHLPPEFLLAHRYRILHQIGQGGFATVYKAEDRLQTKRLVALKQINLGALSAQEMIDATDAYNREVAYLSHLKHENLPRIFDHFTDANNWYVVMEYIEGKTLEERLGAKRGRRFSVKQSLEIGITLCTVLQYLHRQRPAIIFRDLKPANIMISRTGRLYLIDFGIARSYRQGQGKDTSALGSPGYAAPEQYGKNAQTTPQTDVYGLGATLQTLLTGKEPVAILVEGIPPKRSIPRNLQTLLTRMLERDASKRPRDMDAVKQELQLIKDRLVSQRMKRTGGFAWWLLKSALHEALPCLSVSLLLFIIFHFTAFFTSPFWLPYIFIALGIIVGCLTWGLYQAVKSSSTRLDREERLNIVAKYVRSSVILVGLLGMLLSFYYGSQQTTTDAFSRTGELFALGMATLACIIGGLIFIVVWLGRVISWRRRRRASQQQARQQAQPIPLQQQARW